MQGTTAEGLSEEERFERHRHQILKHYNSSFSSIQHFHQRHREGLSEEERFEREKAERQRIAELLAEREKLLSRWARFVF